MSHMDRADLAVSVPSRERPDSLSAAKRRLLETYLRGDLPGTPPPAIGRRPAGAPIPLSHGQQSLWLHTQLAPHLPVYNEPVTLHRRGPLDVAALERSLGEIVRRHEAWRTSFAVRDGRPVQVVQPAPTVRLPLVDLRSLPEAEREPEALRLATEDARRPFDLSQGPPWRAKLIRLGEEEHRLFLTLHHIIGDGVSNYSVLLPELAALYDAYRAGRPSPLPELPIQYGDYAYWQRQRSGDALSDEMTYWRRQLRGAPDLELPTDRPRPPVQRFRGAMLPVALSSSLTEELRALSQREGVTLFVTLLASFQALLHRYTGQDDLLVGTVTAGRSRPEIQELLGFFLNPLLLRTDVSGNPTFRELLQRVQGVSVDALCNQDVPFELLVKELRPKRDPGRNPLYQVLLSLQPPSPPSRSGWTLTQWEIDTGTAKLDLYLELDDRPGGIIGRFVYNADLFEAPTIARMLRHWRALLGSVIRDPDQALSRLPLLSEGERRRRSAGEGLNGPRNAFVRFEREEMEQTISRRFECVAAAHAARIAVKTVHEEWSYATLNEAANRVAHAVLKLRGEGEERVALLFDHDALMIAGILGTLKAGKTYVPLDPLYPRERICQVLQHSQASILLTSGTNLVRARELADDAIPIVNIEEIEPETSAKNLDLPAGPGALAYLLYTSGSTGRPKGVVQSHRNVLGFVRDYTNHLHIQPDDRLSLLSSYGFDAAIVDIFSALLNGATLCPIDIRREGIDGLAGRLSSMGVTIYHSTPTVYRHLIGAPSGAEEFRRIRLVVLGGEEVYRTDVDAYRRRFSPDAIFVNLAGQTESSVNLLYFLDGRTALSRASVPIGYPVGDTEVLLLDEDGEPTEICGEIGIRSTHVALGYWRQPELTRQAFRGDPADGGKRVYRTGDRGRLLPDGSLEFLGRKDLQVKVRGFRIELAEIEAALSRHPAVKAAAAGVWEVAPGDRRLVAYWVAGQLPAVPSSALRSFLREKLPESMVPSTFVLLDALPQTPNGKLDRRALRAPGPATPEGQGSIIAPRDGLEGQLVEMWKGILEIASMGVQDDFFDLGGHSLLAVRLFAEIEKAFGIRLALATLLEAPTVEQLAAVLRERGQSASCASLVPLQPGGRRPPLFGVHGHSGEVLFYRDLSLRLGPDQPFFGLQAQGLCGKKSHRSIEAMAAQYLRDLRSVQPRGPYLIGGYCLGAFVAFEMAQQLWARGEEVALLALFVGYAPERRQRTFSKRVLRLAARLSSHLRQARSWRDRAKRAYLLKRAGAAARSFAEALGSWLWRLGYELFGGASNPPSWLVRNMKEMTLRAARSYVPRMYPGRMTVFLSGETPSGFSLDPERDLDGLSAREVHVISVPGGTDTMMKEPYVGILSARLKDCLDGATARRRSLAS